MRQSSLAHWPALGLIGALFTLKYAPRAHVNGYLAAAAYALAFAAFAFVLPRLAHRLGRMRRAGAVPYILAALFLIALLPIYLRIDPLSLNNDRWSAIANPVKAMLHGEYPYQQHSHLGHNISAFPVLLLIHVPGVALGDIGLIGFAAVFGFAFLCRRIPDARGRILAAAVLFGLPSLAYDILTRSDLFANAVIAALLMHFAGRAGTGGRRLYVWAVLWGFMLSTRGIAIIPLILSCAALLRGRGFGAYVAFGCLLVAAFIATVVPFYLWNPVFFRETNPFYIQSGYIPSWALGLVMIAAVAVGFRDRGKDLQFRNAGWLIYATILGCFLLRVAKAGWNATVWDNEFDVSYFSLALPFLLISLGSACADRGETPQASAHA